VREGIVYRRKIGMEMQSHTKAKEANKSAKDIK